MLFGSRYCTYNCFTCTFKVIYLCIITAGVWLFGNFNFKGKSGMNVKFRDAKCVAHIDYEEFEDEELSFDYPEIRTETDEHEELDIPTADNDYNDEMAILFNIRSLKNKTGTIEEIFNLTALAVNDMYETNRKKIDILYNTSKSESYDSESSASTEDTYNKNVTLGGSHDILKDSVSAVEHVAPTSPSIVPDQGKETFNRTQDVYIHDHNSTDADKEESIIQAENDFTTYFEESTNDTQKEKSTDVDKEESILQAKNEFNIYFKDSTNNTNKRHIEAMEKTNSSEATQSISVAKRDVEKALNYTHMSFTFSYKEKKSKEWEETVPDNDTIQLPHGTAGFIETDEVNFTIDVTSQTSSDSLPIKLNGDQHHSPTVASSTLPPKSHPEFTTLKSTDDITSTSLARTSETKTSITDYHDREIEEMLGYVMLIWFNILNYLFTKDQSLLNFTWLVTIAFD